MAFLLITSITTYLHFKTIMIMFKIMAIDESEMRKGKGWYEKKEKS